MITLELNNIYFPYFCSSTCRYDNVGINCTFSPYLLNLAPSEPPRPLRRPLGMHQPRQHEISPVGHLGHDIGPSGEGGEEVGVPPERVHSGEDQLVLLQLEEERRLGVEVDQQRVTVKGVDLYVGQTCLRC